jgi:hypothetical protein
MVFELRTLCLLGSPSLATPTSPFCFNYFSDRVLHLCRAGLDRDLLFMPTLDYIVASMTGVYYLTQLLLVEMGCR